MNTFDFKTGIFNSPKPDDDVVGGGGHGGDPK